MFENGIGMACIDHSDKDNEREMRICMFAFYTAEKSIHSYFNHIRLMRQLLRNCIQGITFVQFINKMSVVTDYLQF